jgi:hypothetical protein
MDQVESPVVVIDAPLNQTAAVQPVDMQPTATCPEPGARQFRPSHALFAGRAVAVMEEINDGPPLAMPASFS